MMQVFIHMPKTCYHDDTDRTITLKIEMRKRTNEFKNPRKKLYIDAEMFAWVA